MLRCVYIFLLLIPLAGNAQFRNNIWCFGDSAGIDFSNLSNPVPISTSLDTRGSCVSIADTSGNLLFYANTRAGLPGNTTLVWNSLNQLMDNGDSLIGRGWYKELIIVPMPASDSLYYLFTSGITSTTGFYYSVVDMSANAGLGRVIQKNLQLQGPGFLPIDGLTAIKHGNGRDWWILLRDWSSSNDIFYFYLIDQAGIVLDHIQHIGDTTYASFYRIEPSKDGEKIACVTNGGHITVFDFDRCAGLLSNEQSIEDPNPNSSNTPYWSCELSPNKQILYVSSYYSQNDSNNYIFQYNLQDSLPALTRDTIYSNKIPAAGGILELAPDNKIYWSCWYSPPFTFNYPYTDSSRNFINENLSVINFPDSLGASCSVSGFSFYLGGKRTYIGLPNNPNYDLGPLTGSICDTLSVGLVEYPNTNSSLNVFYHNGWKTAFINIKDVKGKNYTLHIVDISGKEIFSENGLLPPPLGAGGLYYTKDFHCEKLSSGIYFVVFETEKEKLVGRFVLQ